MDQCHWVRNEHDAIGKIIIYECRHCDKKEGVVSVDLAGFKLKYSVDPKKIERWIEHKIIASTVNAPPPTSESTDTV
jgi:hypothetical protein